MTGQRRIPELGLGVLLGAVLVLHLCTLLRYPPLFADEPWFAARAWGLIETGRNFGVLDCGVFELFDGHWTFFPWLPIALQSAALRIAGAPALLPMRLVSLFFGLALLGIVYAIGNVLYNRRLALVAVLLVALSRFFFFSAHGARYDTITATFGFLAIALYLYNRSRRAWMGLLSGLCVGLAFEMHPHAAVYGLGIAALYFLHFQWRMFRQHDFWGFVAGAGLALGAYVWFHIARYPQEYVAFNEVAFAVTHTPPILTGDVKVLFESFVDTWASLFGFYHVLSPIIVWAVVALARRGSAGDRVLLVLAGALVTGFVLLIRNRWISYFILLTPVIDLILAAFLVQQARRPWRGRLSDYARWTAIGGAIAGTLALNVYALIPDRYEEFRQAQAFVEQAVEPGDRIMAEQVYWFGLREHDYYSWEALIYYQRYFEGSSLEDAFRAFRPDIFIVDGAVAGFMSDEPGDSLYEQHLWLPERELYDFLHRQATLVGLTQLEYYGEIEVYRIHWDQEDVDE